MSKANSKMFPIFIIDLQLFGEGGDGGTGDGGASTGVSGSVPGSQMGVKGSLNDYGIITEDAQTTDVQNDYNTRKANFDARRKGEDKDLFDAWANETVQKRLKSTKETVDKYEKLTPTIEMLARKYGVDAADIEGLNKAIEEDDTYYEEEALEKGVTVEQLKEIRKMERENAELRRQMQDRAIQEQAERDIADWMKQAQEASKVFPGLDLGEELKNPQFVSMLKNNISLETAYFALHHKELVPQAMQFASKATEKAVVNKVMANGARPTENGMNSQASTVVKNDVSKMTKAQRQELMRRCKSGEKITFNSY